MADSSWSLVLGGQPFDLSDACDAFPRPGDFVVEVVHDLRQGERTVLSSDELTNIANSEEAHEIGQRLVGRLNGLLFVLRPNRKPLVLAGGIIERRPDGTIAEHAVIQLEGIAMRSRVENVTITVSGQLPQEAPTPPHRMWAHEGASDESLNDVLSFLRAEPDWFDLWKAYEAIRADWPDTNIGWPSKPQRDRFTMSAQVHRHSKAKWPGGMTLANAMPLPEARAFIAHLFMAWRERRA